MPGPYWNVERASHGLNTCNTARTSPHFTPMLCLLIGMWRDTRDALSHATQGCHTYLVAVKFFDLDEPVQQYLVGLQVLTRTHLTRSVSSGIVRLLHCVRSCLCLRVLAMELSLSAQLTWSISFCCCWRIISRLAPLRRCLLHTQQHKCAQQWVTKACHGG